MNLRQKVFLGLVIATNATLWISQSDVSRLVARDRPVLLGRYSQSHFSAILIVLLISAVGLYIDQARSTQTYKRRWFQVLATIIFLIPGIQLLDLGLRAFAKPSFIHDTLAYHRPVNTEFEYEFRDEPESQLVANTAADGHPVVQCRYGSDELGYRNANAKGPFDVVTLGDSFTEGCNVSDEQAWPVLFAKRAEVSVYNLGMTGYSPLNERVALEMHGMRLAPKFVICMLYEGNDFELNRKEVEAGRVTFGDRIKRYYKNSPLRHGYENALLTWFNTGGTQPDAVYVEAFSWLPVTIPNGEGGHPYAFGPKALLEHTKNRKAFAKSGKWQRTAGQLAAMREYCKQHKIKLIIAYAPTKAHVILPLIRDRLPMDKVHAFAEIKTPLLPAADELERMLFENLSARRDVVANWCGENEVEFFDLTPMLRDAIAAGEFAYFTYDHHWSPRGNELVADAVAAYWESNQAPEVVETDHED